jgi:chaperonin GroES
LIIPDSAKEKPVQGEVIAIGNGKKTDDGKTIALDVAIGNIVLFDQYAGSEVKIDGESLLVMRENDVIAIIE